MGLYSSFNPETTDLSLSREASGLLNISGTDLAGNWYDFQETTPSLVRLLGTVNNLASEGAGTMQLDTGAGNLAGMDSYGSGDYRTLRNTRLKWYAAALIRIPSPLVSASRFGFGVLEGGGGSIGGIWLSGAISATTFRVGVASNTWTDTASVVSTKTVSDLTGSAGNYKWIKVYCDGINIYGSVDMEAWIAGAAVTSMPSGSGIWRIVANGGTNDRVNVDGVGFWCQR
jgi:hypothetical protein